MAVGGSCLVVPPVVPFYAEALSYASLLREYRTVMNEKYVAQSQVQVDALADKLYCCSAAYLRRMFSLIHRWMDIITLVEDEGIMGA